MVERRKDVRIEKILPILLRGDAFRFVTETKNISCSGAYCKVSKPIPPFTKLSVILEVPLMSEHQVALHEIRCEGVVVRSEKVKRENGGVETYFVAIYFTKVKPSDRDKLNQYITYHLTHHHA